MIILIPTYQRIARQITYDFLSKDLPWEVRLVCSEQERSEHEARGRRVLASPVQGQGMARVRSWILDWCYREDVDKVVMLDDDLTFFEPRHEDLRVVGKANHKQQVEMLYWMKKSLTKYLHCAFTERNAAWADAEPFRIATKGIQAVGYDVRRVMEETDCRFDRGVPDWFFIEDYHMTLQLFKSGYPNIVSRVYRNNFGPSNEEGGCSRFRTEARMEEAAKLLESLHPGIVKAVQKETRTSYGGGLRWNVRVSWRKAYQQSKK